MIDTVEKPSPLQGFIDKWLAAQPQQHVALMFVDGRRYPGHLALAAFEQEMLDAIHEQLRGTCAGYADSPEGSEE